MQNELFSVLDEVDSTNNYATAQIKNNKGVHGSAYFAKKQTGGKGQRGNTWISDPNENITMSVIIEPCNVLCSNIFLFNMLISKICRQFMSEFVNKNLFIKWPNDIYIGDKKAGGILIENLFRGTIWNWAVIGIGINVNQTNFTNNGIHATSLKSATDATFNTIILAQKLHLQLLNTINNITIENYNNALLYVNNNLYKKDEWVDLSVNNATITTKLKYVNDRGELLTEDDIERTFKVGEVAFLQK